MTDTELTEDKLMSAMRTIATRSLPDSVTMLPDSDTELQDVARIDLQENASAITSEHRIVVRARVTDDPGGYIMVMMSESNRDALSKGIYRNMGRENDLTDEMRDDTISEIGNLLISNYLGGMADVLNTDISSNAPEMLDGEMDNVTKQTAGRVNNRYAFMYKIAVKSGDGSMPMYLCYIPQLELLAGMLAEKL